MLWAINVHDIVQTVTGFLDRQRQAFLNTETNSRAYLFSVAASEVIVGVKAAVDRQRIYHSCIQVHFDIDIITFACNLGVKRKDNLEFTKY